VPIYRLSSRLAFPPPHLAEDGLLAVGGDLSRERLLLAYAHGIFPWYSEDEPILWWSPDPRMILLPDALHVSRRLRRVVRQGRFQVTADTAFAEVIRACAGTKRKREKGTWITPEMQAAYIDLHAAGYAHSFECWQDGVLAGGLYGVSLGSCFFGESMFSRVPDASKVALTVATEHFLRWGIGLIDCQVANEHLDSLGAQEVPRARFLPMLHAAMHHPTHMGPWHLDDPSTPVPGTTPED
jgi:leucyl/phenylalanyl-tRNA--protein transferase